MLDHGVMNKLWRPMSLGYIDVDVFICIFILFMTTKYFKAVMVKIPSQLCN
jgi:hypothetical protein